MRCARSTRVLRFIFVSFIYSAFVILLRYNFLVSNQTILIPRILPHSEYCISNESVSIGRCSCNIPKSHFNVNELDLELFDRSNLPPKKETPYPGIFNYTDYIVKRFKLKELNDVKSLGFSPVINDVTPFRYASTVGCDVKKARETGLFIAIVSSPTNFNKRNSIRDTWLMSLNKELKVNKKFREESSVKLMGKGFVIGRSLNSTVNELIDNESYEHGDIIQVDEIDTYYDLTVKVVALLNWLNDNCRNADYVLKVDDDVYVNARKLAGFIRQLNISDKSIYGTVTDGIVQRAGKWGQAYECYPWNTYPVYYQGAAVLMGGKTIGPLLAASQVVPYHAIDDLYLTGFCAERGGVRLLPADNFFGRLKKDEKPKPCHVATTVTWLVQSVHQMYTSHAAVRNARTKAIQCPRKDNSLIGCAFNVYNRLLKL